MIHQKNSALSAGILLSTLLCIGVTLHYFATREYTPTPEEMECRTYTDRDDHPDGTSRINSFTCKTPISFSYTLGETRPFPYAGLLLEWDTAVDISPYSELKIEYTPSVTDDFTIQIAAATDTSLHTPLRLYEKTISPETMPTVPLRLPLKDLTTPLWWFNSAGISPDTARKALTRSRQIRLQNHPLSPVGKPQRIEIHSITFVRPLSTWIPLWVLSLLPMLTGSLIYYLNPGVRYSRITRRAERDVTRETLIEYLGHTYSNPGLTLATVQKDTGISPYRIRAILKAAYRRDFRTYLRDIRLQEAVRLLDSGRYTIDETARLVGYQHGSALRQPFKRRFGVSPREYQRRKT
ncbi:MAG: helix-turn-helix transcriptional regulator [Fibrobacterota bacterium]